MNTKTITKLYDEFTTTNRKIMLSKGSDYANETDRLKNLRASEAVNVSPASGVLVRIMDKITRIANLLKRPAQVKDESIEDTIRDLSNYTFLLWCLSHRGIEIDDKKMGSFQRRTHRARK